MKTWLRLGLLAGVGASAAGAVDWKALRPEGYVSDYARVIAPANRVLLEAYCGAVERATGTQIALVTVPSLEGEHVTEVVQTLYRGWSVGQRGRRGGVLLLMAVRDRRSRVAMDRSLEPILSERRVLREMGPALRQRDFSEAAMAAAETIGGAVARARNVSLPGSLPRRLHAGARDWFPWPVWIGAAVLVVWLMRMGGVRGDGSGTGGGLLPGLWRGRATARATWGANGSGGFGGYDSGDGGFGGFGGGDCAGHTASDW